MGSIDSVKGLSKTLFLKTKTKSFTILNFLTWVTLKLRMATLYTSNLQTDKEATVNLDTWVKVKNN